MNLSELGPTAVRIVSNHQATQDSNFLVETIFSFLTNEAAPGIEKEGPICI